ncbi:hypothetical protein PTMSG1_03801 [Pyrenophora teres f. maculata]|nr:hypothetical protein PTMSG1_03801 [Pyrenophora teres f. maculata]
MHFSTIVQYFAIAAAVASAASVSGREAANSGQRASFENDANKILHASKCRSCCGSKSFAIRYDCVNSEGCAC